jgi:hypothetical protein
MAVDDVVQKRVLNAASRMKKGEIVKESDYIPPIWNFFEVEIYVETIMHLIGHGVIPSCLELTETVFKEQGIWSSFERFANPFLDDIASFNLDWCHVKRVPRSNWLAEDGFGFGRVMIFLYGHFLLHENVAQKQMYSTLGKTLKQLKQVLCSCNIMVCLVMSTTKIDTCELDVCIKIFLSCCKRFCDSYYDESLTKFWFSKSNFISLLNLPDQIDNFGSPSLYWDGSFERFIHGPKEVLMGARKNPKSLRKRMRIMQKKHQWILFAMTCGK